MKIGIIGAGAIGSVLAGKWAKNGHTVSLANSRGPDTLADLATKLGVRAVSVEDAVKDVEVVVITIPQKNVPQLPEGLFRDVPEGVVVAHTGNYYPSLRDGAIAELEGDQTESGWVAERIGRPVVKVFNSIISHSLDQGGQAAGSPGRIALPIAGDDARAKEVLIGLVEELGFTGIDAGPLSESWRQQPGSPAYCTDYDEAGLRSALARADRARSVAARNTTEKWLPTLSKDTTPAEIVKRVREIEDPAG